MTCLNLDLILLIRSREKGPTVKGDNRGSRAASLQSEPGPFKQNRSRKRNQIHPRVRIIMQKHNEAGLTASHRSGLGSSGQHTSPQEGDNSRAWSCGWKSGLRESIPRHSCSWATDNSVATDIPVLKCRNIAEMVFMEHHQWGHAGQGH